MSAFMVCEDTLDLLASVSGWGRDGLWVFIKEDTLPPRGEVPFERGGIYLGEDKSSLIKEELRLENMASLWARYPNDADLFWKDRSSEGFNQIYPHQVTMGQVLGALSCYEYQACESKDWENSFAYALCVGIRKNICQKISGQNWEYVRPQDQVQLISLMDMMKASE